MLWEIFLILSIAVFVVFNALAIILYIRHRQSRRMISVAAWVVLITFISAFLLLFPFIFQLDKFTDYSVGGFTAVAQTIRTSLRVFDLNEDYLDFFEAASNLSRGWAETYQVYAAILYVIAPLMLVGLVVSFFQDAFVRLRLRLAKRKNFYVFSELNEKSLALTESLMEQYKRRGNQSNTNEKKDADEFEGKGLFVFTDVYERFAEEFGELVERANGMGAICLKENFLSFTDKDNARAIDFHKKKSMVRFFTLSSNEAENIRYADKIITDYSDRSKTFLHVLTDSDDSKIMMSSVINLKIKEEEVKMEIEVRCIDSVQSMVYSYLYDIDSGNNCLFKRIRKIAPDNLKVYESEYINNGKTACEPQILSVVLIGLGRYGTELLRALVWYTQIPGIRLQVHVFDENPLAEKKFTSLCPELMKMNHTEMYGEAQYDICFHQTDNGEGIDVETTDFNLELRKISQIDLVYVTLGDDEKNFCMAVKIRQLLIPSIVERGLDKETVDHLSDPEESEEAKNNLKEEVKECAEEHQPDIQTVIFDSEKSQIAREGSTFCDFQGEEYNINFIGGFNTVWSYETIINDKLDEDAQTRHMGWTKVKAKDLLDEEEKEKLDNFYKYEYHRKSSMAGAIRAKVRRYLYGEFNNKEADNDENQGIKQLLLAEEHAGWNAYMRAEGYHYAAYRYDLAKCHPLLVEYDKLPEEEKKKDFATLF